MPSLRGSQLSSDDGSTQIVTTAPELGSSWDGSVSSRKPAQVLLALAAAVLFPGEGTWWQ